MNDLESLLNEHDEGCIGPSLQGTCDCMEKRAIARIKELEAILHRVANRLIDWYTFDED
jgi:hypothetical protein